MAIVALTYGVVIQRSLWYPVNLLAAVAMPEMAHAGTAELRAFDLTALIIGIVAHGAISILAGLLYAVILPMLARVTCSGAVSWRPPVARAGSVRARDRRSGPDARVIGSGSSCRRSSPASRRGTSCAGRARRGPAAWPLAARAGIEASGETAPLAEREP